MGQTRLRHLNSTISINDIESQTSYPKNILLEILYLSSSPSQNIFGTTKHEVLQCYCYIFFSAPVLDISI